MDNENWIEEKITELFEDDGGLWFTRGDIRLVLHELARKLETEVLTETEKVAGECLKQLAERDAEVVKYEKFGKELTESTHLFANPQDYIKLYNLKLAEIERLKKSLNGYIEGESYNNC